LVTPARFERATYRLGMRLGRLPSQTI